VNRQASVVERRVQRNYLLGVVLTLSIAAGVAAGSATSTAQDREPPSFSAIYFPWVPNGDMIDGAGLWFGSVTVQNIDAERDHLAVRIWVFDGAMIARIASGRNDEGDPFELADALDDPQTPRFDLDPNASVTLDAAVLGLPEPGSPVAVFAVYKDAIDPDAEFGTRPPVIAGVQKQSSPVPMAGAATTDAHRSTDGYSAIPLADVPWGSQSDFCYLLRDGVDLCDGSGLHTIGAEPDNVFDGHSYLPIVQTNSGWNTTIYLSNIDFTGVTAAQTNIVLTETSTDYRDGSRIPHAVESVNIPPGGTAIVDVRELVGDDWVGSARITSTVGVVAAAMRSNPSEEMLMINLSAPSLLQTSSSDGVPAEGIWTEQSEVGDFHQYAPLVFRDYHGWNTGFSFVNIAEQPNRVTVSYLGSNDGVAIVDSLTVPARSQAFIYIPAGHELDSSDEGFVGAAHFQAELPFHVAIDQVKYSTGEAMSYLGAAIGAGPSYGETLALPLVQKGWVDGSGDTSGFQVVNPSHHSPVTYDLRFFDSAGAAVSPTRLGPLRYRVGPREVHTVYTLQLSGMPQNQRSSAVLTVVDGAGWLLGVSNNVNYSVAGDGSAAFNLVNQHGLYRLPGPGGSSD
jgi:hypothetical protein